MPRGSRGGEGGAVWTGTGRSMLPSILPGSRLHLAPRASADAGIEVGDVVCFLDESRRFVAHRVVAAVREGGGRRLTVAGDRSGGLCAVEESAVVGVVTRVEHPILSYDTRGRIGRMLSRWALERRVSFRGAALAAAVVVRLCGTAARALGAGLRT